MASPAEVPLAVSILREFEEALELSMSFPECGIKVRGFKVDLTIDREPDKNAHARSPQPPSSAVVKTLEMGPENPAIIQNVPSGRNFLVSVSAVLSDGRLPLRSPWVTAITLPLTKPTSPVRDLLGVRRSRCLGCPCRSFKVMRGVSLTLNSSPTTVPCRGCGCQADQHERVDDPEMGSAPNHAGAATFATSSRADVANVGSNGSDHVSADILSWPSEANGWDDHEKALFVLSRGMFNPGEMAKLRRTSDGQYGTISSIRTGVPERISVVCPTTDARHMFHEQLWSTFDAQAWPDKELIVVETYNLKPSAFFAAKAEGDDRLIFVPLRRGLDQNDMSIGLKRNMCTYLASGATLANFDDDDIYAPSYLNSMVEAIDKDRTCAATLSSWYVFDVACGKFGFVDPVKAKETKAANAPKDIDDWLYGYGFSYVFRLEAALANPYPNMNLGEDYAFMRLLRSARINGRKGISLVYDSYGLCLHTLHARSTSNNWAQREVSRDELEDLDVADLSVLLQRYLERFPANRQPSKFIEGKIERRQRMLRIVTDKGGFSVRCTAGDRPSDVGELLTKHIGSIARRAVFYRNDPTKVSIENPPVALGERVGLRTDTLYAIFNLADEALKVHLKVGDMRDRSISVVVWLPHSFVKISSLRRALVEQHATDDLKKNGGIEMAAKAVRLAECTKRGVSFLTVEPTRWLGDSREFWSPSLAELLGRSRCED